MRMFAIILLVLGLSMMLITSITIVTHKKVVDLGPVNITKEEKTPLYWSPMTGLLLAAVGGSIIILTRKKKVIE